MVTAGRIAWAISELERGRQVRMKVNTLRDKVLVKFCLLPSYDSDMRNAVVIAWLQLIIQNLTDAVVVDHGHQNSKNESHVSIIMKPLGLPDPSGGGGVSSFTSYCSSHTYGF